MLCGDALAVAAVSAELGAIAEQNLQNFTISVLFF